MARRTRWRACVAGSLVVAIAALADCALVADVKDGELGGAPSTASGAGGASGASTGSSAASTNASGTSSGGTSTVASNASSTSSSGMSSSATGPNVLSYRDAVLGDAPSAYWRLDEVPGSSVAADSSGHGINGTYMGGVTLGVNGGLKSDTDTAARFDGTSGFVDFGNTLGFIGTQVFSVELWVSLGSITTDWKGLITKEVSMPTRNGWLLFAQSDPLVGFGFERWISGVQTQAATAPPPLSTWTYIVGTYDGSELRLYVDGQLVKVGASLQSLIDQTGHLVVGARYGGTVHFVKADIDEVAIYGAVLSSTSIAAHYAAAQ